MAEARLSVGWDVGGAHLKACVVRDGAVAGIAQWPCPVWQGLQHLEAALGAARARWPEAFGPGARHAATMTAEMTDLFPTREDGVRRLSAQLAEALGPTLRLYAGETGFVAPPQAPLHWEAIASANWHATASAVGARLADAVLVDIGSTTTDLIPLRRGRVVARGRSDAERLACSELVYHGVVRTPLMALATRVAFGSATVNVMNEHFATTADVYRLTGELDPAHDQQPSADGGAKDDAGSRQRLARMVGRDAREADPSAWLALARHWRGRQLDELSGQLARVLAASGVPEEAPLVAAGCGDFLVPALADRQGRASRRFADLVLGEATAVDAPWRGWAQVCAPAVAVALLAEAG